jgi:hypothetical protein
MNLDCVIRDLAWEASPKAKKWNESAKLYIMYLDNF